MWRVLHQVLYTKERASKLGHGEGKCPRGCNVVDYISCIMFYCHFAMQVWRIFANLKWITTETHNIFRHATSLLEIIKLGLLHQTGSLVPAKWMITSEVCRHLWLSRNQVLFAHAVAHVNVHGIVRNTIDKAICSWKESPQIPPSRESLEITKTLQDVITSSISIRIERWLSNYLICSAYSGVTSEVPHRKEAATRLDPPLRSSTREGRRHVNTLISTCHIYNLSGYYVFVTLALCSIFCCSLLFLRWCCGHGATVLFLM